MKNIFSTDAERKIDAVFDVAMACAALGEAIDKNVKIPNQAYAPYLGAAIYSGHFSLAPRRRRKVAKIKLAQTTVNQRNLESKNLASEMSNKIDFAISNIVCLNAGAKIPENPYALLLKRKTDVINDSIDALVVGRSV